MQLLYALLVYVHAALAVNQALFRRCDQNPFCDRNRHYATSAAQSGFVSPYHLVAETIEGPSGSQLMRGTLQKRLKDDKFVNLDIKISLTADSSFRVQIDEPNRSLAGSAINAARFDPMDMILDPAAGFDQDVTERVTTEISNGQLVQEIRVSETHKVGLEVTFNPLLITFTRDGQVLLTVNQDKLLNFEQLRSKDNEAGSWNDWESQNGAWSDKFDGKTDEKAKGPEAVAADIKFHTFKHVYGIPEHADILSLRNTNGETDLDGHFGHSEPYRLWNVDIFEYDVNSTLPMYGSIPFMVAHRPGASAGLFWANAADTYIDIVKSEQHVRSHWMSESGVVDFFVFMGSTPADVLESYGKVTGMALLPQEFAAGYHQCRWNYNSEEDVLGVSAKFDENDLPLDVIWLDIEYTERKKYFTWNSHQFPTPGKMLSELDKTKRKLVAIIDPHIKSESGYKVFDGLLKHSLAVKDARGNPFYGHCWPGESIWVDTFNPAAQQFLNELYSMGDELGFDAENIHIWNDMNEPSVFSGPETTANKDLLHFGGLEHRDIHNLYGQTFVNGTWNAMLLRYARKQRPFILTRSYFSGSQRFGAMWTGDNQGKWEYLKVATPMVLTSGMAGMPFAGADVGGFFGDPEPELLTRWYQAGAFYPFFRGHAHIDARRREPYIPAEPYRSAIADTLTLRYQLLPYIYTKFWESSQVLSPILRPIFYEVPDRAENFAVDDQFFLGEALMAKPVTDAGATSVDVVLPEHQVYYDYWTGEKLNGPGTISRPVSLSDIPLYHRGGSIYARKDRARRSTELMANDPYTLVLVAGKDGTAKGQLYIDDGISFEHENGDYTLIEYTFDGTSLVSNVVHAGQGSYDKVYIEKIVLVGTRAQSARLGDEQLVLLPSSQQNTVTIRRPELVVGSQWKITIT